jgi:hypothetical protein
MNRGAVVVLVLAGAVAGWMQKDRLMAWWKGSSAQVVAPAAPQAPDIVYQWVDEQGNRHFSQEPGEGRTAVIYDGSQTTVVDAVRAPAGGAANAPKKPAGHEILNLRNELEQDARSMSETRDTQQGI